MSLGMRIDTWGRAFKYWWRRDPGEIRYVISKLRKGDIAIDVGGYKGGYTYWMRRSVGAQGRVITFEPQPALAERLKTVVSAFNWQNVKIEQMALSSEPGELVLSLPKGRPVSLATLEPREGEFDQYLVPVQTIDAYLADNKITGLRLLKLDAEGHELEIFRGASETLGRDRPFLIFECEEKHKPGLTSGCFEFLKGMGYKGYFFWDRKLRPVEEFTVEVNQAPGQKHGGANFVFEPL